MASRPRVLQGPHECVGGSTVITILKDGIRRDCFWDDSTTVEACMLDLLLDEMGFGLDDIRRATRKYCLEMIQDTNMTVKELRSCAATFADGYEACLREHSMTLQVAQLR